ncbi:MAG TPA: hypothetical protein PLV68_05465, partial [Ilumatobacteraceae bacterium]|nr:hypothetical protein [Ilumatobacteraceae bacterium]
MSEHQLPADVTDGPASEVVASLPLKPTTLDVLSVDDEVVLITKAKVVRVGVESDGTTRTITMKLKPSGTFPLPQEEGRERYARAASEHRVGVAERSGEYPLPGYGDVGYTDGSGVVLTDAEVAERQGRGLPVVEVIPAVVVYSDRSRVMWPDDFASGAVRPQIGDALNEDEPEVMVEDLLDAKTGESLIDAEAAPGEPGDEVVILVDDDEDVAVDEVVDDPDPGLVSF